ncbi:hypothetical protein GCM10007103_35020 [Salinimicrobium marinum]|uniref:DUF4393 domain-containing protein n=1 Tax=Salinimicrobium marinum TaxID=680283 RepID=A0A918SMN5_9FLAO|nr:Abi-alpha family protein [Salinimicrobium marinum]GHA51524.1 hypothetical protein GCM10007103_35020 [Salinimicrobium marinum]
MSKELNLKSSTIEKGLDLIKDFASKLIGPTFEEVGLLISDKIKYFRFKNQINILIKAEKYVKEKNIKIKAIPTKILVPLLESASLEENEEMQDKWSYMIGNIADSQQSLQNHIFPYILSQISLNEFEKLFEFNQKEKSLIQEEVKFEKMKKDGVAFFAQEYRELFSRINGLKQEGFLIEGLEDYEYSNLERLGLIRQLPPRIVIDELEIEHFEKEGSEYYPIEAEYDPDDFGFRITSLGIKFLIACEEQRPVANEE